MAYLKEKARTLRKQQTDPEGMLWEHLRNRQFLGLKFRRQYPVDPYVLDFACFEEKIAIEVDGGQHSEQKAYDAKRTDFLNKEGWKVIRVWNNDVTGNIEGVFEHFKKEITSP